MHKQTDTHMYVYERKAIYAQTHIKQKKTAPPLLQQTKPLLQQGHLVAYEENTYAADKISSQQLSITMCSLTQQFIIFLILLFRFLSLLMSK